MALAIVVIARWTGYLDIKQGGRATPRTAMVNFAADPEGLVRIVKRKLRKIQYRQHLIEGCVAGTDLTIEPW